MEVGIILQKSILIYETVTYWTYLDSVKQVILSTPWRCNKAVYKINAMCWLEYVNSFR